MPVQFRDYYETLGVPKTATSDDIRKAFRKLARQFHPDVAKDKKTAEEKFKQINEAYEVLSDSAKREKYDRMGADWQQYEQAGAPGSRPGRAGQPGGGMRVGSLAAAAWSLILAAPATAISSSNSSAAPPGRGRGGNTAGSGGGAGFDFFNQPQEPERGADVEADISVTLEEALHGSRRSISLRRSGALEPTPSPRLTTSRSRPACMKVSASACVAGARPVRAAARRAIFTCVSGWRRMPDFRVEAGGDLYHDLTVAPWQAVLGCEVTVPTLEKEMHLKIPPGSQVGQRFRLRGRGLPKKKGERTDLYVQIGVTLPEHLSQRERELWEQLAAVSAGNEAG